MEGGPGLQNELDILKARLKQAIDRASVWMNEETGQLVAVQENKCQKKLKELQDEKKQMQFRLAAQEKEQVENNQVLENKCRILEEQKTELEKLYSITQGLNADKAKGDQEVESMKKDVEQMKADIEVPTKNREKLEYLSKSSGVFGTALGMTFKKTTGKRMQVTFTHIDEKDPLMPFYFFIKVQESSNKYMVSDPEPPIEGLDEMVQTLNITNNIRQFFIAVRKKFQQTLQKQS